MVDQREGLFRETALAGAELRIQKSFARSGRDRQYANEGKVLIAYDVWVTHDDAGSHATLFVSDRGIEFDHDNRSATEPHFRSSTQPSPGTHRTALPALMSTSASAFSSGSPRDHSSRPSSASSALSGWGFCRERRSSSRRRRSSSRRTASATNLLRFFSSRSMSLTRSSGRVTVTRSTVAISYSKYDHTAPLSLLTGRRKTAGKMRVKHV